MTEKKKAIVVAPHDGEFMRQLYVLKALAVEGYDRRPEELAEFTRTWNARTGRNDTPGEVIHYMRTNRKSGKWPKLNGKHRHYGSANPALSAEFIPDLIELHTSILMPRGVCSDAVSYDESLAKELSQEFSRRTGKLIPGQILAAAITTLRKADLLPTSTGRKATRKDIGFGDIDQAVG